RGVEARKVYADAQAMLEQIIADNLLTLNGVVGIFPAHSSGDDIVVYPKDCKCCKVILPQLRSQNAEDDENLSLADFLLPAGCDDYIGLFAVTAGVGLDAMIEGYRAKGDDYSAIMAELIADRLAEAFAEHLHNLVARELWGYAKDDKVGIRPAVGYPCCPNHQLKRDIFQMLEVERRTGIRLVDDNCMMTPTASVSGMIFASEDSRYFSVGKIDAVQLEDYATRCNTTIQKMKKMLAHNIK
ncbi:MAG: methionine synthase, partial [Rikenellaceae bacterium]|nr:methionine synthase [Rikenellaceae bacterium]